MTIKLPMLSTDDKIAEIKRLYYRTTRETIAVDLARALELLKSFGSEEERERAAVYMDGLAQMRSDWAPGRRAQGSGHRAKGGAKGRAEGGAKGRAEGGAKGSGQGAKGKRGTNS